MSKSNIKNWTNGLFVAPYLIVYIALLITPLVMGWWISFRDVDMLADSSTFIGLSNYSDLLNDDIFIGSIKNTFYFVALTTPIFVALGLSLALALNRPGRTGAVLRSIFFGSSVLSVTIVTLVWRLVLMPEKGLLSNVMHSIGMEPIAPLVTESMALPAIGLVTVWWIIGLPMMLFLAALQQIPHDIYEAAALDNASRWKTLTSITIPSIKHTIALVAIVEVILQFQLFGQSYIMTQGGPNNSSRPIVQFIYEAGFTQWALGYSAAASQVLFGLMLIAVSIQAWIAKKRKGALS